eukprot:1176272-Prorocentrum_minimum.AAC.7
MLNTFSLQLHTHQLHIMCASQNNHPSIDQSPPFRAGHPLLWEPREAASWLAGSQMLAELEERRTQCLSDYHLLLENGACEVEKTLRASGECMHPPGYTVVTEDSILWAAATLTSRAFSLRLEDNGSAELEDWEVGRAGADLSDFFRFEKSQSCKGREHIPGAGANRVRAGLSERVGRIGSVPPSSVPNSAAAAVRTRCAAVRTRRVDGPIKRRKCGYIPKMDQSNSGSAGIFPRWTNQTQEVRVYSQDGPIRRPHPTHRFSRRRSKSTGTSRGHCKQTLSLNRPCPRAIGSRSGYMLSTLTRLTCMCPQEEYDGDGDGKQQSLEDLNGSELEGQPWEEEEFEEAALVRALMAEEAALMAAMNGAHAG